MEMDIEDVMSIKTACEPTVGGKISVSIFYQHLLTASSVIKCFAGNKTDNALPKTETALFLIIRNYFLTA